MISFQITKSTDLIAQVLLQIIEASNEVEIAEVPELHVTGEAVVPPSLDVESHEVEAQSVFPSKKFVANLSKRSEEV